MALLLKLKKKAAPKAKAVVMHNNPVVAKEKPKAIIAKQSASNIFGIDASTMLLTDLGRLTKAGFILEFYKLRSPICIKMFDEIKALLAEKAFMVSESVHLDFLLKSFDRVCVSVYNKRDKITIEQMKETIMRTLRDIQSNIVSNIITILPDC